MKYLNVSEEVGKIKQRKHLPAYSVISMEFSTEICLSNLLGNFYSIEEGFTVEGETQIQNNVFEYSDMIQRGLVS